MLKVLLDNYKVRKRIIEKHGLLGLYKNNSGYILLIVLLISAFLISLTSDFFLKTHTYISTLKRLRSDVTCEYVAYSGFEIAKAILDVDRLGLSKSFLPNLSSNRNIDCYKDIWALDFPDIPVMDFNIKIVIEDENSKINISSIANERVNITTTGGTTYYGILQRFFLNMGLPIDIADALADWEDPDDIRFPYGAESSGYYLNLKPSYSAKNGPIDSIDELLLVKGITPEIFFGLGGGNSGMEKNLVDDNKGDVKIPLYKIEEMIDSASGKSEKKVQEYNETSTTEREIGKEKSRRLSDYLNPYGNWADFTQEINRININTASFRVLLSLSDNMTEDIVKEIIRRREQQPFTSVSEIKSFVSLNDNIINVLAVKSLIFKITITAKNENSYSKVIYYYDRNNKKLLYCSTEH